MKSIFLDTNIYLHYEFFDQINWLKIIDAESIIIVVPPITIRELNKHKDYHTQPQVKKRAGEVLSRLSALFDLSSVACIRDKINMRLEDRDPLIDFGAHQLNFEIQDDQLIASMIMYRSEEPIAEILLVTSDEGLALLAKARRYEIKTVKMPDNLRIMEQPDPSQKRIAQLEQELRELKTRMPSLSLTFLDGDQHAKFMLPPPLDLAPDRLERELSKIKEHYPKRERIKTTSGPGQSVQNQGLSALMASMAELSLISEEEITRYNNQLDKFYLSHEKYLKDSIPSENLKRRTIELLILLANDGTAPAEDIDIFMHLPNGFKVLEKKNLPEAPEAPEPPTEPRTTIQMLTESINRSETYPYIGPIAPGPIAPPPNVSAPKIKHTNSYEVSYHVQKVKHNMQEPFKPLYIVFDSFEETHSFHIDYRILAANIPHEINGKLHIVIQKENCKS
jgi:predicted nucleic acid-binding protein